MPLLSLPVGCFADTPLIFYREDTNSASLRPSIVGAPVHNPMLIDYAALLLRIALALMFFAHAWLKIKVFTPAGSWIVGLLVLAALGDGAVALGPALGLS